MRTLNFKTVNPLSQLVMWAHGVLKYRRSVWNPGICRPYAEAAALGLIELKIADLVSHLNVAGIVKTHAACEGHWLADPKDNTEIDLPCVSLSADIAFVGELNRVLIEASPMGDRRLNYHWIVEYGIGFTLRPHVASEICRTRMDQDFATIRDIVDAVVSTVAAPL